MMYVYEKSKCLWKTFIFIEINEFNCNANRKFEFYF